MPTIKLVSEKELIVPSTRQRQDFNQSGIVELQNSIRRGGLLQPLIVRNGRTLVAGERRLRALRNLWMLGAEVRCAGEIVPPGLLPCVDLGELGELERAEAEYDENTKRADYTWQERAAATAQLTAIRERRAEAAGVAPPSIRALAGEIKKDATDLKRELIVSRFLDDPEVRASGSVDDAFKVLVRREEGRKNQALGELVGKTFTSELHTALNVSAFDFLRECPAESFDVVLTDPPYGMGADEFGDSGGTGGIKGSHGYVDDYGTWQIMIHELCPLLFRVAKPQAHAYIFCDIDRFHELRGLMSAAGWWVFRTPLIFHKPNAPRAPWPEHGPQRQYDLILYAVKGKRPVTRLYSDVIIYRPDSQLDHSAQKPVALFEDLLRRSVRPGDTVLDPFMGTGTIFPAAHGLKCRATGVDSDLRCYGIALKRLEALKERKELPL